MDNIKEIKRGHTYYQWIYASLANLTLFAHGVDVGWISPTTKILQSDQSPTGYPLSDSTIGWIASILGLAAVFGVSLYTYIADVYGRKTGVIFIALLQAIATIIKLSYSSTTTLIISRILCGVAAGGCFNVVPMYIKEISDDDIRGILGTFSMFFQTNGVLVIYVMGAYLDYFTVIKIALVFPIIAMFLLLKAPESPAFLVKQGKIDEAISTIAYLRGLDEDDDVVREIVERICDEDAYFQSLPKLTIANILKQKPWRRGFFLIITTMLFRAFNGAYAVITFASTVMVSTGVEFNISPEIQTLSFPVVLIISALLLACIVERIGRKILLFSSLLISTFSMSTIAILIIVKQQGDFVPIWLPAVTMMIAVTVWAGVSSLPYIVLTEMFSFEIRAKVMGVVGTIAWIQSFILLLIYTPMVNTLGEYSPFILYAIANLVGSVFTLVFLPETRGKSEEEILKLLTVRKATERDEVLDLLSKKSLTNDAKI